MAKLTNFLSCKSCCYSCKCDSYYFSCKQCSSSWNYELCCNNNYWEPCCKCNDVAFKLQNMMQQLQKLSNREAIKQRLNATLVFTSLLFQAISILFFKIIKCIVPALARNNAVILTIFSWTLTQVLRNNQNLIRIQTKPCCQHPSKTWSLLHPTAHL